MRIRKEEYTTLGDFILPSFERDQAAIAVHFPKFDAAFLAAFTAKLAYVKALESSIVPTEEQKAATTRLYGFADELGGKLAFLNSYLKDAGLNTGIVTALKKDIFSRNIEGAVLKLEGVKQYVESHLAALEAEGMPSSIVMELEEYKHKLEEQNTTQNQYMNSIRVLIVSNKAHYDELYGYITKIAAKGKLVFKGTTYQDEYSINKSIGRMRFAKLQGSGGS